MIAPESINISSNAVPHERTSLSFIYNTNPRLPSYLQLHVHDAGDTLLISVIYASVPAVITFTLPSPLFPH